MHTSIYKGAKRRKQQARDLQSPAEEGAEEEVAGSAEERNRWNSAP